MPTLTQILHTLVSRLLVIIFLAIIIIPGIIILLIPARYRYDSRAYYWFLDFFYRGAMAVTLLPVRIIGAENIPQEPVIIAANHQSSLDIPIIGKLLKRHPHVWLAKKELLEAPSLRYILPRVTVLIDMSTPLKGMRSLVNAINMVLNHKRHAIIFPEGTRYTDGNIHEFFNGFVVLAKKTGRPVLPIRIFGLNEAYPADTFWVRYRPITLVVGQPMALQENETDEAFKDRVYNWFLAQREP